MNRTICTLVFMVIGSITLNGCKPDHLSEFRDLPETRPAILEAHRVEINANVPGYYSAVPVMYEQRPEKRYPLLISFHGAGGYGNGGEDLKKVLSGVAGLIGKGTFPPNFTVEKRDYSFIVLAPQFRRYPKNEEIRSFIEYVTTRYRIDESRIYLAGLSLGGKMCSEYAAARANEVTAVVTMGGCLGSDTLGSIVEKCKFLSENNVGVWAFHNRSDLAWPVKDSEQFIKTIQIFSPQHEPKITLFDVAEGARNHDCWSRASSPKYKEGGTNIYEWLLQFHK